MKYIFLLFVLLILFGCSKKDDPNEKRCYECDTNKNGNYIDVGCYTDQAWSITVVENGSGEKIDKDTYCRKR